MRESADYSGGFLCRRGVITARLLCLIAAPPSGESVVLPVKVTPKTHNSQTGSRKSTGSGQPSVTGQSSREETVWHTIGVIMTNKKK